MYFKKLRNDEWFDEIRVETQAGPIVYITTIPRFKTSGMSGNEWHVSAKTQMLIDGVWKACRSVLKLDVAAMALYPELYNHPSIHNIMTTSADFYRKAHIKYRATYDDKPLSLIHAAGHLPWALVIAGENSTDVNWTDWCFQPGCPERGTSLYRLKRLYSQSGDELVQPGGEFVYHQRFCNRHLLRGNASLEDGDDNYIVISGPGPEQTEQWEEDESPAVFGGVIDMRGTPCETMN